MMLLADRNYNAVTAGSHQASGQIGRGRERPDMRQLKPHDHEE